MPVVAGLHLPSMSVVARRLLHSRVPNYSGYWSLIRWLPPQTSGSAAPASQAQPSQAAESATGVPDAGPQGFHLAKPEIPTNCCMSGCKNCVWDDYQEELETYRLALKEYKLKHPEETMLPAAAEETEMDPSMKAFLELEKSLHKP
ncbi:uncharacterized protein BJ171DRAFT_107400 [Polychytrium aggregatum]|uniref:uncharacterized protein n=1 Tax=Polychytrium aggregatum TaxID=110093 RepID=UPI0022FEA8F1|nr:uncharacterized protein BJ171DRAFT_107400 [Polychytrium aggregatum]KAI9204492.1 hypothetical protein BJ171DRAFT_107400 [Polychytrium aggregatum]